MEIVDMKNIEFVIRKGGTRAQRQHGRGQKTEAERLRHPCSPIEAKIPLILADPFHNPPERYPACGCFTGRCMAARKSWARSDAFQEGQGKKAGGLSQAFAVGGVSVEFVCRLGDIGKRGECDDEADQGNGAMK